MGYSSTLYCELPCTSCGAGFFDRFCFCWGKSGELYKAPGETIRWATRRDGSLLPHFTLYGRSYEINMGFPETSYLLVSEQYYMEPDYGPYTCEKCGEKFATAIAEIVDGRIRQPAMLPLADKQKYEDAGGSIPAAFRIEGGSAVEVYDVDALVKREKKP
ncbi:MAG: hypothetical protein KDB82_00950 [Planctomycetes bacterium]|nr:hypothetical protein [Planctomycetota bacterium]